MVYRVIVAKRARMDIKSFLSENPNLDERSFGQFIRQRREELGKTVRGFAAELDITPAYLSDIEKGNRYAPKNYLDKLKEVLKISKDDEQEFEDLASVSRGSSFEDINCYLGKTRMARVALRRARDSQISDDEWEEFIKNIDKSNK